MSHGKGDCECLELRLGAEEGDETWSEEASTKEVTSGRELKNELVLAGRRVGEAEGTARAEA